MYGWRSAGLGTMMVPDCLTGEMIDCDSWSNLFNSTCWNLCSYTATPNPPMPVPPVTPVSTLGNQTPLTTAPADQTTAQQTVDSTIAATTVANQVQNQNFFSALATAFNPSGCTQNLISGTCDSTIYLTAAAVVVLSLFVIGVKR